MAITQRSLYKTIEKIGEQHYLTDADLLVAILDEIIRNERIKIIGGRIWRLSPKEKKYHLIYEEGKIDPIGKDFRIDLNEYAVFGEVARNRTVLADETNRTLRAHGIIKYSATGIGERIAVDGTMYYEYLMAFNTLEVERELQHLLSIAGQAATHLLQRRRSESKTHELESEMAHARDMQKRILPEHEYSFADYDLYGICLAEKSVGGDFFNYMKTPGYTDRISVAIGDAASKGFPAAVQALFVSGALMMSAEFEAMMSSTLRRLNTIIRAIFPNDKFLTLFYCQLYAGEEGLLIYANAGHSRPIHFHAKTGEVTELAGTGPVLGLLDDASFGIANTNIAKNDVLVLYTDGITEANNGKEEFGEERLIELIKRCSSSDSKTIASKIIEDVQKFSTEDGYSDDKTVVVIKRKDK
ncbi:MAG: serine/threonine protein phosphatase [Ectothiorhodospiraceae bacterium]|nr:serine/threonine protein phosphatase [Ectothiorhodospiraceae bacterium]